MKRITFHTLCKVFLATATLLVGGCKDYLVELNENPNGADPGSVHPNLVLSTVLTQTARSYLILGYQDLAGVMQHTQKDGWVGTHNNYDWQGSNGWDSYFEVLRNNKIVYDRSVELGYEFHQGVALVVKSYVFGLMADLWGDVPYSEALQALDGGVETMTPRYDSQEAVYRGVLADLETANTLLSKAKADYAATLGKADVYFNDDPAKWRAFANSLMLRYYMRLAEKLPDVARPGIERIVADPTTYPIILQANGDATMAFPGTNNTDAWPFNETFDATAGSDFRRIKLCSTFVEYLRSVSDPRLGVWARRVQIPIRVDGTVATGTDRVIDGVRVISPDVLAARGIAIDDVNQNPDYVGIPPSINGPQSYNLSPDLNQASNNPHVSWLNDRYRQPRGDLLKARLISAAEVHFILAEAALKGWAAGDARTHYEMAIQTSFDAWGLSAAYAGYVAQPDVAFDGSVRRIIEQKWIASWTAAAEAWFDWRRTGYPQLATGSQAIGPVLPVRFYYMTSERELNKANVEAAIANLATTAYTPFGATGGPGNSAWSKPWVIQGTGKPW